MASILCSGYHERDPDLRNLPKQMSGFWINPDTGERQRISYTTHRFCNNCKYAIPRKGNKYSKTKRCPCCKIQIREGTRVLRKKREALEGEGEQNDG